MPDLLQQVNGQHIRDMDMVRPYRMLLLCPAATHSGAGTGIVLR